MSQPQNQSQSIPNTASSQGSVVLLEEYFNNRDNRFLDELNKISSLKKLAGFADTWKKDPRPWARKKIFKYLSYPLDKPGHNALVKRLFKHAEQTGDNELMGAFLVAFDCLVRRVRKKRWRWDMESRSSWGEESLVSPRNTIPPVLFRVHIHPITGKKKKYPVYFRPDARLFSYHTRNYLRRRAWRYFRKLGFQNPESYPGAISIALKQYKDEDFAKGENILDNWGFVNAAFYNHKALNFGSSNINLAKGAAISELEPAPRFPELWAKPDSAGIIISIILEAGSRMVRVWAIELFRVNHMGSMLPCTLETLTACFNHKDKEVQEFACELLANFPDLNSAPLSFWMNLLEIPNIEVLDLVCREMIKYVNPKLFTLEKCMDLACKRAVPIARLGLRLVQARQDILPELLVNLAHAKSEAVAGEITGWALSIIGNRKYYDHEIVIEFFDSLVLGTRSAAWEWLIREESDGYSGGYDDPVLWARLTETPYDDLRLKLVEHLDKRITLPGTDTKSLSFIWCSVLSGIHRGGRHKLKAVMQLAHAIEKDIEQADNLLPVLSVAVRSIRKPEMRAGLAAIAGMVTRKPEMADKIKIHIPELEFA